MSKPKGFTLIELLVAIAVIVLLMAILLPALRRVRKHCGNGLKTDLPGSTHPTAQAG